MWILRTYRTREVFTGAYHTEETFRQYFVDEDADKAQMLTDELNAAYERLGCDDAYSAEVHKCED